MLIDFSKIKTADARAQEKLTQEKENAINARKSQFTLQTDPALLEILLKRYKDDPEIAPIWEERLRIQTENPYPEELI